MISGLAVVVASFSGMQMPIVSDITPHVAVERGPLLNAKDVGVVDSAPTVNLVGSITSDHRFDFIGTKQAFDPDYIVKFILWPNRTNQTWRPEIGKVWHSLTFRNESRAHGYSNVLGWCLSDISVAIGDFSNGRFDGRAQSAWGFRMSEFHKVEEYERPQLLLSRSFRHISMLHSGFGGALGDLKRIVGVGGGRISDQNRPAGIIERHKQPNDASNANPKAPFSPVASLLSLIRRLPFGAQFGFTILFALPAWLIMFRGWDRLDGFGGCIRDRRKGLAYCGLAGVLLVISMAPFW